MKKTLLLLLAALLALAPVHAASARAAGGTYRNETNGYSIDCPDGWTLISKETVQSVLDAVTSGEKKVEGMDGAAAEAYDAQIRQTDMAVFTSEDGAANANITYMPVPEKYSGGVIIASVCPVVLQKVKSAYPDYEATAEPQVVKIGGREFVEAAGQYTVSGVKYVMRQAYHCTDSTFYAIGVTVNTAMSPDLDASDALFDAMLASFVPA